MAHDTPLVTDAEISLIRNCARSVARDGPMGPPKANLLRLASGSQIEWLQQGPGWTELLLAEIARLRRRCASHDAVTRGLEARAIRASEDLQLGAEER